MIMITEGAVKKDRRKKNDVNPDTKRIMKILMIVSGVVIALLILFLVGNAAGFFKGAGLSSKTEKDGNSTGCARNDI